MNRTDFKKIITSALVAVPFALAQTSVYASDLFAAWQQAREFDAGLKSAMAQIKANNERSFQANAALGPSVSGTASVGESLLDTNKSGHKYSFNPSLGVQMTYPIYRLASLETLEQSKLQVTLAQTQLAAAEQDLMLRVAQAYFDILAAQDSIAFTQAQKRAISEQLASAKRNFEVGTQTVTDQQEAQARFDLIVAQELAAENDLDVRKAALMTLTGNSVDKINGLIKTADLIAPAPNNEKAWTDQAATSNFAVVQARIAIEIAKREISKANLAKRPTVDLVGAANVNRSSTSVANLQTRSASIGLQLNVPIFTSGSLDSREREAIVLVDKSENDLLAAQRIAMQTTRSVYKKLASGLGQIKALQQAEKSSQLALDSNQLGYKVGVRINIDVLNAQQQLFSTRRDLSRARYDALVDGLRLKQASGSLSEADLKALTPLLQPVVQPLVQP